MGFFSSSCLHPHHHHLRLLLCLVSVLVFILSYPSTAAAAAAAAEVNDTEALAIFMRSADIHANLATNWTTPDACSGCWTGVTCSPLNGRVTSLSLPYLNLRGPLESLSPLDQLRLLDLHGNRLNGTLLPFLPSLLHLKLLYLSGNDISGEIPKEIGLLARLTRVDLSNNNLRGPIPTESVLANLTYLLTFRVQNNLLSGILPDLSVSLPQLSEFNASDNLLYGRVPDGMMAKFGLASFSGNAGLCGPGPSLPLCSLTKPPPSSSSSAQSVAPSNPSFRPDAAMYNNNTSNSDLGGQGTQRGGLGKKAVIGIVFGNVMLILVLLIFLLAYCFCCGVQISDKDGNKVDVEQQDVDDDVTPGIDTVYSYSVEKAGKKVNKKRKQKQGNKSINNGSSGGGERVEDEDHTDASQSKLVFFQESSYSSDSNASSNGSGGAAQITDNSHYCRIERRRRRMRFGLEELLRASAEMLGKGSLGTVYRAVLEDGSMVAVKRLKDANPCNRRDFHKYMDIIGRLTHPNIVPLKAYYYAPQEKLLIYDYLPNGTLYSLLHGNRGTGRVPLDWTTRVSLMLGAARGLAHIHQAYNSSKIPHGNIKSSNVLIDKNGIACISDFGLALLLNPVHTIARLGGYTAPEQQAVDCSSGKRVLSQEADVYGFGVLILELLTGRAPAQYPSPPPKKTKKNGEECQVGGVSLPEWVKSVVKEEWTAEVFDAELMRYKSIEDEMVAMLHVGLACVDPKPERRPSMLELVSMIEEMGVEQSPLPEEEEEEDLEGSRVSVPPSILTTNTEDGRLSC